MQAQKEVEAARMIQFADTEMGISAFQIALSDSEHSRQMLHDKYVEEKKSREQAEQESIELRVTNEELRIKLSTLQSEVGTMKTQTLAWKEGQGGTVATLKHKVERRVKENHDLIGEIERQKHEVILCTYILTKATQKMLTFWCS